VAKETRPLKGPGASIGSGRSSVDVTQAIPQLADDEWRRLCDRLARRADQLRDPVTVARLHHQRALILADELGDHDAALPVWRLALDAWAGHLPTILSLREVALRREDRALGELVFDRAVEVLGRPGTDPRDAEEVDAFFLLVWLFRWPDRARASRAVDALDALGDPSQIGARAASMCLGPPRQAARLRRRLDSTRDPARRAGYAAELADLLLAEPGPSDAADLLREAADHDIGAAWRLTEVLARAGDDGAFAGALEGLARMCPSATGAAIRFLAGEIYEMRLDDPQRADALYAGARAGGLRAVVALKRVLVAARAGNARGYADALAARASLGDAGLDAVLARRAAELYRRAGDEARAFAMARRAHEYEPGDLRARALLERLAVDSRQWAALSPLLEPELRAALTEHALRDPHAATALLGQPGDAPSLLSLRTRQRLLAHATDPEARAGGLLRAQQLEANALQEGERRADLYLRVGRAYMARRGAHEKALTYLFWVLDREPEHLVALRLVEHICRAAKKERPLMEVLARSLPLLDRAEDRFPMHRELGRLWEVVGQSPEQAAEHFAAALASNPKDEGTVADLERIYTQLGREAELEQVYESVLEGPELPAPRRKRVTTKLNELRVRTGHTAPADPVAPEPRPLSPVATLELLEQEVSLDDLSDEGSEPDTDAGPVDDETLDALVTDAVGGLVELAPASSLPPLPRNAPMPPVARRDSGLLTAPPAAGGPSIDELSSLDVSSLRSDDAPPTRDLLAGAQREPPGALDFLGEEVQRAPEEDPGRAVIAAKLRRSRGEARDTSWSDHGDPETRSAISALESAADPDARADLACALGALYETSEHPTDAIRAYRTALGYRAGDAAAGQRLEALFRATGDWAGLVDILGRAVARTGDPERKRSLLLEVARLERGPLEEPAAAIDHFREALTLGPPDRGLIAELAGALKAVRRWDEYVDVLTAGALADPDALDIEEALELGRVHLYELGAASNALPYILRAARALPERVDVAADLAEARALTGEVDRAIELLRDAVGAASGEARTVLQLRLARLYEEHGEDPERARTFYRLALDGGVRDPAVLDRIERLAVDAHDWETLATVVERHLEEARLRGAPDEERRAIAKRLGHLYYKRLDRPRDAAAVFVDVYELDPGDHDAYRIAEGLLQRQPVPDLQVRLYRSYLAATRASSPTRVTVGLRLVAAHESEGNLEAAVVELEELHRFAPADAEVLAALERVYRRAEKWPALVAMYRDDLARLTAPEQRAVLLRRLALALEVGLRDLPAATEVYEQLHELDPSDVPTLQALARLLEAQKRWNDLLAVSARQLDFVSSDRQRAYIHFRMGSLHETHLGDLEAAGAQYRRALRFDPRCFPALHGLREIAANAGRWEKVVEHLRQELALWDEPKERAAVHARIAEIHAERLDDPLAAIEQYQAAVGVWPACIPAARALAQMAFDAERWEEAAPHFQVLTKQNLDKWPRRSRSDLFYKRGVVAARLGRNHEAVESLKLALEFDPANTDALQALVRAYAVLLDDEEGFRDVLARLDEDYDSHAADGRTDEQARIDILRGHAAEQGFDLEAAAEFYRRAIQLRPDDLDSLRPLVDLFVRQRRFPDATATLRVFAERVGPDAPDYVAAMLLEGELWCDGAVDPGRAADCYRRVLEAHADDHDALFRIAQCHFLQRAFEEARECMERLLSTEGTAASERATHLFYLGRIQQTGFHDAEAAVGCYEAALSTDPACASALLALLQLRAHEHNDAALAELLTAHRRLLTSGSDQDAATAALKTFAANLLFHRGDAAGALRLLRPLADGAGPGARDARFALVPVFETRVEPERAVEQLVRILDENVCDIAALSALADLLERHGDDERLLHVLSVLDLFKSLEGDWDARFRALRERARRVRDKAARGLTDELVHRRLAHASFRSPVVRLITHCEPALARQFAEPSRPTLRRGDQVTGRRHPFSLEVRTLQTLLAWRSYELYFCEEMHGLVRVWSGDKPLVVVGDEGLSEAFTTPMRSFLVARAAFVASLGLARIHDLGPERALDLIRTVGALYGPRHDDPDAEHSLLGWLPPRNREAVEGEIAAHEGPLPASYTGESVLRGVVRTADRAGLLACGQLRSAVCTLALTGSGAGVSLPHEADLTWAVRSRSRLEGLVKYALSESYHQLRRALGLAI